jgi:tetratricopeptide (TPR) repeat protein
MLRCSIPLALFAAALCALPGRAAPENLVDLTPVDSGPGLLVAEPAPAKGAESLAAFGAGCARILHFRAASNGAFGKTPPWIAVDIVRRNLKRADMRLTPANAARAAAPLGVTHIALGAISGTPSHAKLSYSVWDAKTRKTVGAPLTVTGTEGQIIAGLPKLTASLVTRLHGKPVAFAAPTASAEDVTALGKLPWALTSAASMAQLETVGRLAPRLPVAALSGISAVPLAPRRSAKFGETLMRSAPENGLALAAAGGYRPARRDAALPALAKRFPNNALYAIAVTVSKAEGSREQMLAAAHVARCAPDSSFAWRYLSDTLGDVADGVRRARGWAEMSEADQKFVEAVYPSATRAAAHAAQLDPLDPRAWQRFAVSATFVGDDRTADRALRRALKLDPNHANSYSWAMQMYQPKWLDDADALSEMANAASRRLLEPPSTVVGIASAMRYAGFPRQAVSVLNRSAAHLEKVLALYPKDPDSLDAAGDVMDALDRDKEALSYRKRLVALVPADGAAQLDLSYSYYAAKQYADSEKAAAEATRLAPNDPDGHIELAYALKMQNKYPEAEKAAREAVRLAPQKAAAHYVLARALDPQTGRTEETLAEYRETVRLSPYWGTALRTFGDALLRANQLDDSIEILRRAIGVDPENAYGYYEIALAFTDAEKWDMAAQAFEAYLHYEPANAFSHRRHGDVLLKLGRKDEARAEWTEALRLDPNGPNGRLAKAALEKNP